MSHIDPKLQPQFDSLPSELQTVILDRNVQINTMQDLMKVLQDIVAEDE